RKLATSPGLRHRGGRRSHLMAWKPALVRFVRQPVLPLAIFDEGACQHRKPNQRVPPDFRLQLLRQWFRRRECPAAEDRDECVFCLSRLALCKNQALRNPRRCWIANLPGILSPELACPL